MGNSSSVAVSQTKTPVTCILLKRNGGLVLEAYKDANYIGSIINRRSASRYCTVLGRNLVTWRTKNRLWLQEA